MLLAAVAGTTKPKRIGSPNTMIAVRCMALFPNDGSIECNLKAVVLKASTSSIGVREEDAQGTATRRTGQKHAPASGCARSKPGSARSRLRHQPNLSQRGRAVRAQRLSRQHCAHCERVADRTVEVVERLDGVRASLVHESRPSARLVPRLRFEAEGFNLLRALYEFGNKSDCRGLETHSRIQRWASGRRCNKL